MMTEQEIIDRYSTPGLRRGKLTRASKRLAMEFDDSFKGMTPAERTAYLDLHFPEEKP